MRKKLTILFALLCASVMGFAAIDWSGYAWLGNGGVDGKYSNKIKAVSTPELTGGAFINNLQTNGGHASIHIAMPSADFGAISLDAVDYHTSGAGFFPHLDAFKKQETEFTVVCSGTTYTFTVYYEDGTEGGEPTPTPGPEPEPAGIDWSSVPYIAGQEQFKIYFTEENRPSNWEGINIQTAPWAQSNTGIYVSFPNGVSACSLGDRVGCWIEGAQVLMYLSAFSKQVTEVTINHASGTKTLYIYNKDGEPDDLTGWNIAKGKTSTAGFNAEAGHAGANDGNFNSRWSSNGGIHYPASGAQDWWYVDLGDFYRVDQIKILFEGAAPTDYDLLISNNAVSWKIIGTYSGTPKIGNNPETDYNEYDFTDKIGRYVKIFARAAVQGDFAYGISMYEFEVYGDHASIVDVNPPVMGAASLSGVPLYNQVNIAVTATDTEDGTVGQFHVVDASKSIDQVCTAAAGVIAVVGLEEKTSYSFTITALDAAGNESENTKIVDATTPADPTMPTTAAPVPSGANKDILPVYSDAFTSILQHNFSKNGFDGPAMLYKEANIAGDHFLVYDLSSGPKFVIWGMWNNEGDAIIAQSAYRAEGKMGIDASEMEYMHVDIWSLQPCSTIWVNVNDEGPGALRLSHEGNGWQGFDIALSDITVAGDENKRINNVRWLKFRDFGSVTGKLAFDNVYFWKTSTSLKSVSATPNNAEYGSASVVVKSTELAPEGGTVEDGTEVTFSATPKEGYVFVNWSNGETNATFNAVVNSNMNLTANFRALNHICCNEEMTNGDYTAYVTYKKTANDNEYVLIVRSAKEMVNFTNAYVGHINGTDQINMNGQGVLSGNGHMLSYTFTSTTEPKMNTPLYINFAGHGEVTFNQINNSTVFEFLQPCADPEITAIELNKTEATLDMGNTLTLVPTFTPAYMSADITWQTSDANIATVSNGVVTPVTAGNVTITAKVTEDIKATCSVTVQDAASHNWYGYGTDKDLDYTYRIEYTTDHHIVAHVKRQGDKTGLVDAKMLISGVWTYINNTEGEEEGWKKGTTEATFTAGNNIHILIQSDFSGASSIIEFDYEVGSDNDMPTILPSTLALSNTSITMGLSDADVQLTAEIHHRDAANKTITWTSDNESIVTVVDGLVHPVGVGRTTVHAATFNGISATCEVTVVGALEPTIFWGSGEAAGVSILYSITRNTNHTLTYAVEALQNKVGFEVDVNDGQYHDATLNEGIYTWTSEATYTDGTKLSGFIHMPYSGGVARVDFVNYVVGSESEKGNMPIRLYENQDNSFMITASDGLIRDVKVTRSFAAGNLYTLVLPFDVDAAQTAAKLPGQLTKLNNSYLKDNGDLRINFVNASAVEAGVPYLYQPSANVANPTFEGVTVRAARNPSEADPMAKYYGIYAPMDGVALHNITNAYVLGPDQYLYAVSDLPNNQTMKALRAYFVLNFPETTPGSPKRLAKVVFNENETETTTDIEDLQTDIECTKVIVNGQLQIIRDGKTYNAFGQLIK